MDRRGGACPTTEKKSFPRRCCCSLGSVEFLVDFVVVELVSCRRRNDVVVDVIAGLGHRLHICLVAAVGLAAHKPPLHLLFFLRVLGNLRHHWRRGGVPARRCAATASQCHSAHVWCGRYSDGCRVVVDFVVDGVWNCRRRERLERGEVDQRRHRGLSAWAARGGRWWRQAAIALAVNCDHDVSLRDSGRPIAVACGQPRWRTDGIIGRLGWWTGHEDVDFVVLALIEGWTLNCVVLCAVNLRNEIPRSTTLTPLSHLCGSSRGSTTCNIFVSGRLPLSCGRSRKVYVWIAVNTVPSRSSQYYSCGFTTVYDELVSKSHSKSLSIKVRTNILLPEE